MDGKKWQFIIIKFVKVRVVINPIGNPTPDDNG